MATFGGDYVYTVMLTAQTNYADLELDEGTTLMFVNRARVMVFNSLCEMYPHLFQLKKTGAATLVYADADNFYQERGCMEDPGGGDALISAAKVSFQELWGKQDNKFSHATVRNPLYTVEKKSVALYTDATMTPAGDIVDYYLQSPIDLDFDDEEVLIPDEAQELVIRKALVFAYEKKGDPSGVLEALQAEYKSAMAQFADNARDIEENMRLVLTANTSPQNIR